MPEESSSPINQNTGGKIIKEITLNIPPVPVNLNAPALERTMALLAEAIGWNTAAKVDRPALNEAAAKHYQPETKPVAAPVPPPAIAEQIPLQPPVQAVAPAAMPVTPPVAPAPPMPVWDAAHNAWVMPGQLTASVPMPAVPVAPQAQQPVYPTAAPVAAPTYTMDQLSVAATGLVDAGKTDALLAVLGRFGIRAMTQLAPEQYGAFATELRGLGAAL